MAPVLVGMDGSPHSVAALQWADWFSTRTQHELHVVHAWQHGKSIGPLADGPANTESLEERIEARLQEVVESTLGAGSRVTRYAAVRGDSADALLKEASTQHAALIVVGTRGMGGALRVLLGSVARRLTEYPARPVAVVPDGTWGTDTEGWALVVGADGSAGSSRAVRWAGEMARRGGGEVIVVHAFEPPLPDLPHEMERGAIDEARRRLDQEWCAPLREIGVAYRTVIERGDAPAVVRWAADETRPACVVAGSRGLSPFSQRVLGSVTHALLRELEWPTVVIPSPRDCVVWGI